MLTAVVLGGNADQVPLIEALKRRGYRVVLIDYYPAPLGKALADAHHQVSTLDPEAVSHVVELERPRFITSVGNDLVVPVLAEVSARHGLPCNQTPEHARMASNKALMKAAFRINGIPTARQLEPASYQQPGDRASLPFPLIGKQLVGYGARGVARLNNSAELDAFLAAYGMQGEVLIEEFLEGGQEISVDCFASEGKSTVLLVSCLHQAPGLHQQFSNLLVEFPFALEGATMAALRGIAQRMAQAFGISNGPFFFQAMLRNGGVQVIEMGARIAGGRKFEAIRACTGFNALEAQIDVLEHGHARVEVGAVHGYHLTAMLFANPGTVSEMTWSGTDMSARFFPVKQPGFRSTGTCTGDERAAVLSVHGEDRKDALQRLMKALDTVSMRGMDGRELFNRSLFDRPW